MRKLEQVRYTWLNFFDEQLEGSARQLSLFSGNLAMVALSFIILWSKEYLWLSFGFLALVIGALMFAHHANKAQFELHNPGESYTDVYIFRLVEWKHLAWWAFGNLLLWL